MALKRLTKELKEIKLTSHLYTEFTVAPVYADDLFKWQATIFGPQDSPYADGKFNLSMIIPTDYPFQPPKLRLTKVLYIRRPMF